VARCKINEINKIIEAALPPQDSIRSALIIACEDIQVMWKDATGFVTSFPNSYQAYY
jgi:hypothetical protein